MRNSADDGSVTALEQQVLRVVCQDSRALELARKALREHRWSSPVHQIVFETVTSMPTHSADLVRWQLPVRLTLAGFPDVAWEEFLQRHRLSPREVKSLILRLRESSR